LHKLRELRQSTHKTKFSEIIWFLSKLMVFQSRNTHAQTDSMAVRVGYPRDRFRSTWWMRKRVSFWRCASTDCWLIRKDRRGRRRPLWLNLIEWSASNVRGRVRDKTYITKIYSTYTAVITSKSFIILFNVNLLLNIPSQPNFFIYNLAQRHQTPSLNVKRCKCLTPIIINEQIHTSIIIIFLRYSKFAYDSQCQY
jgi:hypothetical protein